VPTRLVNLPNCQQNWQVSILPFFKTCLQSWLAFFDGKLGYLQVFVFLANYLQKMINETSFIS